MVGTFLCINIIRDKRRSPTEKFRRRGILRDASSTHFTGFRPNLGIPNINGNNIHSNSSNNITSIGITTPLDSGEEQHRRQTSARFFPRNVHF
uniref:Uncharacterized protein n=1 Tax=Panagrolaimus sp. ES5 TaxID=591445 RepID=A0AC34FYY8_9BILA